MKAVLLIALTALAAGCSSSGAKPGSSPPSGATSDYVQRGTVAADQVIVATGGKADTLLFNTPQFLVFQTYAKAFKAEYAKNCARCKLGTLDVPITDVLAGNAGSEIVSYLRSHPGVNHISCNTSNFCQDLPTKAKAAGIVLGKGHVGLTFGSVGDAQLPLLADGTAASGQATPFEYVAWQVADAMARYSVGDSIEPNWKAALPEYLRDAANTAGAQPYEGPTGYQAQFTALWKA